MTDPFDFAWRKDRPGQLEIKRYFGNDKHIVIPDGVTRIGYEAFAGCDAESIELPESLEAIEFGAFRNCAFLESITIPRNVTEIEDHTFSGCHNLKSVILNSGVTAIGFQAFGFCRSLEEIDLPYWVNFIDEDAFYGCTSLKKIYTFNFTIVPDCFKKSAVLGFVARDVSVNTLLGSQVVQYLKERCADFKELAMDNLPLLKLICSIQGISAEVLNDYIEYALEHNLVEQVTITTDALVNRAALDTIDAKLAKGLGISQGKD